MSIMERGLAFVPSLDNQPVRATALNLFLVHFRGAAEGLFAEGFRDSQLVVGCS